jgi:hypothetical protein
MAQVTATKIFADIGVPLEWHRGASHSSNGTVSIEFETDTPSAFHPGALAYAMPSITSGTQIHVFLDRVLRAAAYLPAGRLLGYVIAHELAHIFEGVCMHSTEGIMQGYWNYADFKGILTGQFHFSPEDVEMIRAGVRQIGSSVPVIAQRH